MRYGILQKDSFCCTAKTHKPPNQHTSFKSTYQSKQFEQPSRAIFPVLAQAKLPREDPVSMKPTIPATSITANQATIAASRFSGDWRQKKYQRKRIRAYGEINRKALKDLGARIVLLTN
jgi:hypothetical protein